MAGGTQRREVAELDEPASALLITYLKNTAPVRDFKKRLFRDFYLMRAKLTTQHHPLVGPELLAAAVLESQKVIEQRDARILQLNAKIAAIFPRPKRPVYVSKPKGEK